MKEITFRPLRRVKKTGKIVVASYWQWRKVKVADYGKFLLAVNDEYRRLPLDEFVYDHEGKQLFWQNYNPSEILMINQPAGFSFKELYDNGTDFATRHGCNVGAYWYHARGLDCDGVPCFVHYTADHVANYPIQEVVNFEPLTVKMVVDWFGWFLYQLENSNLQIGN